MRSRTPESGRAIAAPKHRRVRQAALIWQTSTSAARRSTPRLGPCPVSCHWQASSRRCRSSDLTRGHPPGEAMRACLLATELARRAGLDAGAAGRRLLRDPPALRRVRGDVARDRRRARRRRHRRPRARRPDRRRRGPLEALRLPGGPGPGVERLRMLARAPRVARLVAEGARADCEVGADLTRRLRLPEARPRAVLCAFERFDGGLAGGPRGRRGRRGGAVRRRRLRGGHVRRRRRREAAAATVARWSGRALDPAIAAVFLEAPEELLATLGPGRPLGGGRRRRARAAPRRSATTRPRRGAGRVRRRRRPQGAVVPGPFARRRAAGPRRRGSSAGVDATLVYRAGLVHDLGRVAVPTGVWERPGPLRPEEWELVRLHPYHSGRILARSPVLARWPRREPPPRAHRRVRLPGRRRAPRAGRAARLLAAADVLHALGEPRPHRAALDRARGARGSWPACRWTGDAIRAVLEAADAPPPALPPLPADLTERELDVLRLLVAGRTKRQIAGELFISHSTVHTHTVHIYAKCGVSTRAGLAMFAMRHGLAAAARSSRRPQDRLNSRCRRRHAAPSVRLPTATSHARSTP